MSQAWKNRDRIGFSIPEDLYQQFEDALAREGQSMAKVIGQFLVNYVEHLDRSFVGADGPLTGNRRSVNRSFTLPEEIVGRAREKASREGLEFSRLMAQFIRNYVGFVNGNGSPSE